jgi:hypothetical protein
MVLSGISSGSTSELQVLQPGTAMYLAGSAWRDGASLAGLITRYGLVKRCPETRQNQEAYKLYCKHFEQASSEEHRSRKKSSEIRRDLASLQRDSGDLRYREVCGIFEVQKDRHTRHNQSANSVSYTHWMSGGRFADHMGRTRADTHQRYTCLPVGVREEAQQFMADVKRSGCRGSFRCG